MRYHLSPALPLAATICSATALASCNADPATLDAEHQESAAFSFVVFGDNQFATGDCMSGLPVRMALPPAVGELAPDLILHTGDLMDHGYEVGAYESFVSCYQQMLDRFPFFPTMGNHDAAGAGIDNYAAYLSQQLLERNPTVYNAAHGAGAYARDFPLDTGGMCGDLDYSGAPGPTGQFHETAYAFRFRNSYFLSFEQGTRFWTRTPVAWVECQLRRAREDPSIEHIFVYMHHPMYSTSMWEMWTDVDDGTTEYVAPVRMTYEELFRRFDVTVVFSGHAHVYDRFYVPDDGWPSRVRPAPGVLPSGGNGVHYVVTGGGGAPLWPPPDAFAVPLPAPSRDYSQARRGAHHLVTVQVDGPNVDMRAVGLGGNSAAHSLNEWEHVSLRPGASFPLPRCAGWDLSGARRITDIIGTRTCGSHGTLWTCEANGWIPIEGEECGGCFCDGARQKGDEEVSFRIACGGSVCSLEGQWAECVPDENDATIGRWSVGGACQ